MEEPSWLTSPPSTNHKEDLTASPPSATPAFKVILVGEAGVGKTTIFSRLRHPEHAPSEIPSSVSIGVDTCTRTICTRSGDVTITVWDTAGAEKYRTLTRNYFRNTHAALLVFSVEDPASLYSLPGWQRDVGQSSPSAVQFLVGNKSDLERQITDDSMHCFADSHNCQAAFLISAKTGEGVEGALSAICDHLINQSHHRSRMNSRDRLWQQGSGVQVHGIEPRKDGTKCCS